MKSGDYAYIWQSADWPDWRYDIGVLAQPLAEVSRAQGLLLGRLADVGLALRDQASLAALTDDVLKTSEIEGELLNVDADRELTLWGCGQIVGLVKQRVPGFCGAWRG